MNISKWLLDNNYYLIDQKVCDVNGDGTLDIIYLVASLSKHSDNKVFNNIRFVIIDGKTYNAYEIILPNNPIGYDPKLFVGSFTSKQANDIFISVEKRDSDNKGLYYLYSFLNNKAKLIFDTNEFNNTFHYNVIYRDDYNIEVINQTLKKDYIIGIANKDNEYLDSIYNSDGELIEPTTGEVLPLNKLYPINILNNGLYQLCASNKVIGLYGNDTLGYIMTLLYWDKDRYKIIGDNQFFSIVGVDI